MVGWAVNVLPVNMTTNVRGASKTTPKINDWVSIILVLLFSIMLSQGVVFNTTPSMLKRFIP